jgi:hypothetical protein
LPLPRKENLETFQLHSKPLCLGQYVYQRNDEEFVAIDRGRCVKLRCAVEDHQSHLGPYNLARLVIDTSNAITLQSFYI